MADSAHDNMFDGMSFYIGEEDFHASNSVCDSDISVTDSESGDCDDGDWLLDNESVRHYADGSIKEGLMSTKPDLGSIDINSIAANRVYHLLYSE